MSVPPNGLKSATELKVMREHARELRDASRRLRVYAARLVADSRRLRQRRGPRAVRITEAGRLRKTDVEKP